MTELSKAELKELQEIANKLPVGFMERINHYKRLKKVYKEKGAAGVGEYLKPYFKNEGTEKNKH